MLYHLAEPSHQSVQANAQAMSLKAPNHGSNFPFQSLMHKFHSLVSVDYEANER